MSIQALNEAFLLLKKSGARVFDLGPASEQEVEEFSGLVSDQIPTSYREFLKRCGSLSSLGIEFYGLIPDDLHAEEIPNSLWLTSALSKNDGLPDSMLVVEDLGDGAYACLALQEMAEEEAPVVLWEIASPDQPISTLEQLAASFGEYVLDRVNTLLS